MLSAIILSGGKSSRMGKDKASLIFEGRSFLENQKRRLEAVGIEDIIVSGYAEGMLPDEIPGQGPMGGLFTCLKAIKNDACLVLPIDTPLVTTELLKRLIAEFEAADCELMVLQHGEKIEPLIGVYSKSLVPLMAGLIAENRRALRALMPLCRSAVFEYAGDDRQLMNCNYPEEYNKLLKRE